MGGESRDVSTGRDNTVSLLPERLEAASRPRRKNLRLASHSALQPTAARETKGSKTLAFFFCLCCRPSLSLRPHLLLLLLLGHLQGGRVGEGGGLAVGAILHLRHLKATRQPGPEISYCDGAASLSRSKRASPQPNAGWRGAGVRRAAVTERPISWSVSVNKRN